MTLAKAKKIAVIDGALILATIILAFVAALTALPVWVPLITLALSIVIDLLFLRKSTVTSMPSDYEADEYDSDYYYEDEEEV